MEPSFSALELYCPNTIANKKVPGYFLLNLSSNYTINSPLTDGNITFFSNINNLLDENFETGGIFAENEVDGTGKSGTFVTPGQPMTVFGGLNITF